MKTGLRILRGRSGMAELMLAILLSVGIAVSYLVSHQNTVQYVKRFGSLKQRRQLQQANLTTLEYLRAIIRAGVLDYSASTAAAPYPAIKTASNGKVWYASGTGADLRLHICSPAAGVDGFGAAQTAAPCAVNHYLSTIKFDNLVAKDGKQFSEVTVSTETNPKAPITAGIGGNETNDSPTSTTRARVDTSTTAGPVPPPPPPPQTGGTPTGTKTTCSMVVFFNYHHGCGPWKIHDWTLYIPGVKNVPLVCKAGTCGRTGETLPDSVIQAQTTYGANNWIPPGCIKSGTLPYPKKWTVGGIDYDIPSPDTGKKSPNCEWIEGGFSPLVVLFGADSVSLLGPSSWPRFDIDGSGPKPVAWPAEPELVQFLALDRNGNGKIDGIAELFGNATPGSDGQGARDGFLALFKEAKARVLRRDNPLFSRLRLWSDRNRNGKTDPGELRTLAEAHILELDLRYSDTLERLDDRGSLILQKSAAKLDDGRFIPLVDFWPARADGKS